MKYLIPIAVEAASLEAALNVRNYVETAVGAGFNANEFDGVEHAHTGDANLVEDPEDMPAIEAARAKHAEEGEIEIDDNAKVSYSTDGGAYVQGWLWVGDDLIRAHGGSNPETEKGDDDVPAVEFAPAEDSEGGTCD